MASASHNDKTDKDALDPRKAAILEAVVSEYISAAQPVGSATVAAATELEVSAATIRSEMVALEKEGYLTHPHTSAGRIPTDKGYRHFVDQLAPTGTLGKPEQQKVATFFDQVHGEMEEMMARASGLLSELTSYAAVVVPPSHEAATVRSIQIVSIDDERAVVIAILSDGAIEKRIISVDGGAEAATLAVAATLLSDEADGKPLGALSVTATNNPRLDALVSLGARVLSEMASSGDERVFVGGGAKVAQAFDAVETVRNVLTILERQLVVVSLLRDVLHRGLSVAIGSEHGYEPLASCAVVVAPVTVDGEELGAVGILGPTRMHYPETLAAANAVSKRLSDKLAGRSGQKRKGRHARS